ncbi:hypothetical protein [Haloarcula argentinensis]|uniref:hypothetical protein n=1 Tax=Haloarcula argentinensis TaxID=43776 RepID=UPI0002B163EF|nr:hypothetical protein [Haloarcula argentinensis]EMA25731.1 hypothetical protein C443_02939 [Haloarcula argentinensis DSM 12282]
MPDILDTAQIELEECFERLDESKQITPQTCGYVGRDAESAVRTLQMKTVNAAPGLKAQADDIAEQLHDHVDHLVAEGPLNSNDTDAHSEDIEELRRLINEARDLAMSLRDDDFELEEIRNRTTMSERFEQIGRAAYDHPELMEEPLEELFRREPHLEPPVGRLE